MEPAELISGSDPKGPWGWFDHWHRFWAIVDTQEQDCPEWWKLEHRYTFFMMDPKRTGIYSLPTLEDVRQKLPVYAMFE